MQRVSPLRFSIDMTTDNSKPKAKALVELIEEFKKVAAQNSKNKNNKTEMRTTEGKVLRFTEPD